MSLRFRLIGLAVAALLIMVYTLSVFILHGGQPAIIHGEIRVSGKDRSYVLLEPPDMSSEPLPLVFAFHGAMGEPNRFIEGAQLNEFAADHGMLVVVPEAINRLWGVPGVASEEKIAADLDLFDQLIEKLAADYPIDRNRIYVIGMSQGASHALHLCSVRSEVIAACAAHSHSPPPSVWQQQPPRAVPIMLLVGDSDQQASTKTVLNAGLEYRRRDHEVEMVVIKGFGHRWDRSRNDSIAEFLKSKP